MGRSRERPRAAKRTRKVTSAPGQPPIEDPGSGPRRPTIGRGAVPESGVRLRIPIALKFAVTIALLVVVFMGWQTYVTIRTSLPQLERQINQGGLELVTALASLLRVGRVQPRGEDLGRTLESFQRSQAEGRVLNVVVYDEAGEALATARRESGFTRTRGHPVASEKAGAAGVTIHEFDYEGIPVRSFRRAADSLATGFSGDVEIYISAQDIAEARAGLSRALLTVSITACLGAAAGAFLLARILTRPIRALVRDLRAVSHGDLDHQSRVRSSDELGDLARTFNIMTRNLRAAQEARMAQKALEHELAVATRIQTRLLPQEIPDVPGLDIAAYYVSAKEVGGDYYDFIPIGGEHLGVVVADVSGKGIPAALVMTMTRSLLRMASARDPSPSRVALQVNRALGDDMSPGMFVSMAYLVVQLGTHEAQLVRCGHNAPLYYRARDAKLIPLQPGGIAIGLDRRGPAFSAQLQVQRLSLREGDFLVLYSDGIVEAKSPGGDDYGDDRLAKILAEHAGAAAGELVDVVIDDLKEHRRGAVQSDDITLLVIRKKGGG